MEGKTLYDVLGIKSSSTIDEIKNTYRKMIKKMHPDKNGNACDVKLLNKAYAILRDSNKRREYDNSLKIVKKSNNSFAGMKQSFNEYCDNQKLSPEEFEKAKKNALREFEKQKEECNKRIGYDKMFEMKQQQSITDEKLSQLEFMRDQEYIENIPNMMINDASLTQKEFNNKFNDIFENTANEDDAIIEYTGEMSPYNDGNNLSNIDMTNDSQCTDTFENVFSKRNCNVSTDKRRKHIAQNKTLEELMDERETETKHFLDMKSSDFSANKYINASGTLEISGEKFVAPRDSATSGSVR